jgi:hypothetical protein
VMVIHTRRSFEKDESAKDVAPARFVGVVLNDSTHLPIPNAEVSLPVLGKKVLTNAAGEFAVTDVVPGEQQVLIRHLGYGVLDAKLEFVSRQTLIRTIYLSRVTALDSVLIRAAVRDPRMDEFEEHKLLGLGHFMTRAEIAKFDDGHMADMMVQIPGVQVIRGKANHAWIASSRGVKSLSVPGLDPQDRIQGAKEGLCYPQVYMDDAIVDAGSMAGTRSPLFDLNTISPASIEAIEVYSGPSQTPAKYMKLNSDCGVMVIHTRR